MAKRTTRLYETASSFTRNYTVWLMDDGTIEKVIYATSGLFVDKLTFPTETAWREHETTSYEGSTTDVETGRRQGGQKV